MSGTLNVGIIGCGRMGSNHIRNLKTFSDVKIVAVCDVVDSILTRVAQETGAVPYATARDLLQNDELDAVYVATNTPSHADLGIAVMESGRKLFVEKPLVFNVEDGQRLIKAAQRTGQLNAVGHQWRYLQGVARAKEVLGTEPLSLIRLSYYWTWPLVDWIAHRETGGGQVMDQGVHLLDLARYFAGEISEVYAKYTLNARKTDNFPNWDAQVVAGEFTSGTVFSLSTTYALFKEIADPAQVDLVAKDLLVRITPHETYFFTPNSTQIFHETAASEWREDRAFVDACLDNNPPLILSTIDDAFQSLSVVLAANASAKSGRAVQVSS